MSASDMTRNSSAQDMGSESSKFKCALSVISPGESSSEESSSSDEDDTVEHRDPPGGQQGGGGTDQIEDALQMAMDVASRAEEEQLGNVRKITFFPQLCSL